MPRPGITTSRKEHPSNGKRGGRQVESLGLRQGEKFVVAVAATVFLVCVGVFATKETIATTPAELQKKAEEADSNLNRKRDPEALLTRIEEEGIKDPGFVQIVENQTANALKPGDYRAKFEWVTPEPGAGLIRDEPAVVVPTELAVFTGRGGVLLYATNDKGEKIPDTAAATAGSGMGRPGPATAAGAAGKPDEDKKRRDAEQARLLKTLAGKADTPKDEPAKKDETAAAPADLGPWKEESKGKRWVVITGVVDNEQMNKNWLEALKNPAIAYPQYRRVDVQRQSLQSDGEWPDAWTVLNDDEKWKVLDLVPQADEELVPLAARPELLVDFLPQLKAGYWSGVHVARLVPSDAMKVAEPPPHRTGRWGGARWKAAAGCEPVASRA